jgi:hypothetical protein
MSSTTDSSVKITKPFSSDTVREKEDLALDAEIYRDKLENQWSSLKVEATEYGKQALVIGGVVTATFLVMNAILPKSKKDIEKEKEKERQKQAQLVVVDKKKVEKAKTQSHVLQAVQSLAWTLAVGWARQKIKHLVEDERKSE